MSTNWISLLANMMGWTLNSDYYTSSVSGAGFAYGTTFESQLTTLANSISDKSAITDIIVGGGFNDRSIAKSTVESAISSFVTYAKSTFPNAKVHIGFISWSFNSEFISELITNNVLGTYKQCAKYGASYIDHSDEVMHDSTLFEQESQSPYTLFLGYQYVHPSTTGATAIANCIANYIKCGSGVSYDSNVLITPTLSSGVSIGTGDFTFTMRKSGNNVQIGRTFYTLVTLTFSTAVSLNGATPIELGMLESGLIAGVATTNSNTRALSMCDVIGFVPIGSSNIAFNAKMMIANNRLYLLGYCQESVDTPVTTIALYAVNGNFNTNEI